MTTPAQEETPIKKRTGWSSEGLEVVDASDPRFWTINEAAERLGPPKIDAGQLRILARIAGLEPKGKRRGATDRAGRHARVYLAEELIALHDRLPK